MRALLLGMLLLAGAANGQALSPAELEKLARFESERTLSSMPPQWREKEAPRLEAAYAAARADFVGQGARVAQHYLRHTGTPPGANAYFFVLEAVGGADAAALLARALVDPPQPESGPEFESGGRRHRLARHEGEIQRALEAVFAHEATGRDAKAAQALGEAIGALRARSGGLGAGMAALAIGVLGRASSDEALALLRRYATDPDPQIRTAALQALGGAGVKADAALLARTLAEDPAPGARAEAARSLTALDAGEALPALRRALFAEARPEVVDAVLRSLAHFKALPTDPQQCYELASRAWELQAAALAAACWRARAGRDDLVRAALDGPPIRRALALIALFERPATRDLPLLRAVPRQAPPPPVAGSRAQPSVGRVAPPPAPPAPPRFDDAERRRLLASAAEVLSRPLSHTASYPLNELLFEIAGRDMALALDYADRIATRGGRSVNDGRLAASHALARQDSHAYAAARRVPQALLAGSLLLVALLAAIARAARAAAIAAAVPLAAWLAWTLTTNAVRELPPLALALFTVAGSASLAAALASATAAWRRGFLAGLGAVPAAAVGGFLLCGALRWYDVFPVGGEGWELILEPVGAAAVAAFLAVVAVPVAALSRRIA